MTYNIVLSKLCSAYSYPQKLVFLSKLWQHLNNQILIVMIVLMK